MKKESKNNHLSADFIAEQKRELETKLEELLAKQKELAEFPDIGNSLDDSAQEASEFESNLNLKHNVDELIVKVKQALKRIDKGTYGVDIKTNEPIEQGRLAIMPEAESAADSK